MKKCRKIYAAATLLLIVLVLSGCCLSHEWQEATCTAPKTCAKCGKTEGETLPHGWMAATCTSPKTCKDCGLTEGEMEPHTWNNATCSFPKTCAICGATEGEVLEHTWQEATCEAPETCSICGGTRGEPLGHVVGETKAGAMDCVKAVQYWDTYCQTCGEIISSEKKNMKVLYENKKFLMSPQEFVDRLNNGFRCFYGTAGQLEAKMETSSGSLSANVYLGNTRMGYFMFYDTTDPIDQSITPDMTNKQGCFNSIMSRLMPNDDTFIPIAVSAFMALDPSLDMNENADEIGKLGDTILSRKTYQYNGITYGYSYIMDMHMFLFGFGT